MEEERVNTELHRIGRAIEKLTDKDLFLWFTDSATPTGKEVCRAATIVAYRLCGAVADPIIRNVQEQRQLQALFGVGLAL